MIADDSEGLLSVGKTQYAELPLSDEFSWFKRRIEKFVVGGIYLLAGQPGIGKSTLGIQLALDLGRRGKKTLFILTEQSKDGPFSLNPKFKSKIEAVARQSAGGQQ